ncbi:CASP8-associated protein 2 [Notolabrus celidotus]|uniref:CASP8-associated protein 2 n=1 Tax=Notolabrus celidotus TaxID=1203425 RepID=UPI0014902CAE|nr:CASP8-associated protein 2 [Notolabrus celidotus]
MESMDTSRASGTFVPAVSEDSVDIYDGLDMSVSSHTERSPPHSSHVKESMDLYEELVTEEQQSRESTYAELKSRFQAAQNQIKELRRRLEQMELQNTGLNTENYRLKKNISALLLTAKQEVKRKDAEIQRLNQMSGRGYNHLHHPRHQSHHNNIQDQKASSRTPAGSSGRKSPPPSSKPPPQSSKPPPPSSKPPPPSSKPPPQSSKPPPPSSKPLPPPSSNPPLPSSKPPPPSSNPPPASSKPPPPSSKLPPPSSNLLLHPPNLLLHPLNLLRHPLNLLRHPPNLLRHPPILLRHPPNLLRHPQILLRHPPNLLRRPPNLLRHPPILLRHPPNLLHHPPILLRHPPNLLHHSAVLHRCCHPPPPPPSCPPPPPPPLPPSPPRENNPAPRRDPPQPSRKDSSSSQPGGLSIETRACKALSHSHSKGEEPDKSSTGPSSQHGESDKHKSKHREEKSESTTRRHRSCSDPNKDGHEKSRSHKEHKETERRYDSRSGKGRNHLNTEGHHRSERTKSPPPETPHSEQSKTRELKARMSTSDSEHSSKEGHSRDHRKNKSSHRHLRSSDSKEHRKSSSTRHSEHNRDTSKEREGHKPVKDYQRKEEKRQEDEANRKHKRRTLLDMSRKQEKSKEPDLHKAAVCSTERKKTQEALKRSSEEPNTTVKISVDENSPNRKLCFMETLNLTLSPIKKPVLPFEDLTPVDRAFVDALDDDEDSQPNVEDMCVIDEVNSSELEAEEPAEELKTAREDAEQKKTRRDTDKQDEGSTVQTTSAQSKPLETAEKTTTKHHTTKPPASVSLEETEEDKTKRASDTARNERGSEATGEVSDTSGKGSLQKVEQRRSSDKSVTSKLPIMLDSDVEMNHRTLKASVLKSPPVDPVKESPTPTREGPVVVHVLDKANPKSPTKAHQSHQQEQSLPTSSFKPKIREERKKDVSKKPDGPKEVDSVSSTISLESLPQEGLSLPEAIYMLTQTNEDHNDKDNIPAEPSSSTGCIAVSKVSSTTEEAVQPEKFRGLTFTPRKNFSPGKTHQSNVEPSSSVPFLHDEDSMMRTLSSLKSIPDAISPLRSPVRITRRTQLHLHGKPGHVKSLQKEFSSPPVDANSKKLDVNKENKYPGSPANHDPKNTVDKVSDPPSSLSDTDLEEGEILSESDDTATDSPAPASKRAKTARPARSQPRPEAFIKRTSEERRSESKEISETAGGSGRSPRSRFKTVCPAATKASFATVEDVMGTFKLVRSEIRKKYMKLHKTFPRKSFYGVMDNFQVSFLEFVDGAYFGKVCSQEKELKSKLKKLITSVFGKVSNNGIVKRIFEQQAVDLKQKLWDFVDTQVDFMFKDIYVILKSLCKPTRAQSEDNKSSGSEKVSSPPPEMTPPSEPKEAHSAPTSLNRIKPCAVVPYRTGLGSRGKDIRITHVENDKNADSHPTSTKAVVSFPHPKMFPSTPEKSHLSSLVHQNASMLDKTDFELLTEQQASSLTFNLVRDSQMGEIFKCLLQGSDLLETSGITGDHSTWSLSTPRKDGERLFSITTPTKFDSPSKLLSPLKFDTPSKLVATWSSISPRKMSSPRSRDRTRLNPALFDESCLLEVPSESKAGQSGLSSHRSFSILAEDLAVSLTIPSPLKSDSHLSFLQPSTMNIMSTPDSVISAHISEDALMDGEDASEQDIHLALDTDISSCDSNSSSGPLATPFLFKPDAPMQALVMERSNDHFILKIRQAAAGADVTLTADDSLSRTLTEEDQQLGEDPTASSAEDVLMDKSQKGTPSNTEPSETDISNPPESFQVHQAATEEEIHQGQEETKESPLKKDGSSQQQNTSKVLPPPDNTLHNVNKSSSDRSEAVTAGTQRQTHDRDEDLTARPSPSKASSSDTSPHHLSESSETNKSSRSLASRVSDSDRDDMEVSGSDRSLAIAEDASSSPEKHTKDGGENRKRKKHQEKSKAKRPRKEKEESEEERVSNCKTKNEPKSSPSSLSPSSLHAKNVVRKKGEVVLSWSREEDRDILVGVKTRGASRETFSALSEKLQKPSGQIAHRFNQLLKLFKKQEKKDP